MCSYYIINDLEMELKVVPAGILDRAVTELGLSVRSSSGLKLLNIETIGELTNKSKSDLYRKFNLGEKSLHEIAEALSEYGLFLKKDT
jgi:DNA-directed RNA polymerase alpha subunit